MIIKKLKYHPSIKERGQDIFTEFEIFTWKVFFLIHVHLFGLLIKFGSQAWTSLSFVPAAEVRLCSFRSHKQRFLAVLPEFWYEVTIL